MNKKIFFYYTSPNFNKHWLLVEHSAAIYGVVVMVWDIEVLWVEMSLLAF